MSCPVHEKDPRFPSCHSYKVHIESEVGGIQTGSNSGFSFCKRCGLVLKSYLSSDDAAGTPSEGIYVDPSKPNINPRTEYEW